GPECVTGVGPGEHAKDEVAAAGAGRLGCTTVPAGEGLDRLEAGRDERRPRGGGERGEGGGALGDRGDRARRVAGGEDGGEGGGDGAEAVHTGPVVVGGARGEGADARDQRRRVGGGLGPDEAEGRGRGGDALDEVRGLVAGAGHSQEPAVHRGGDVGA